jgi:hypothetical protein
LVLKLGARAYRARLPEPEHSGLLARHVWKLTDYLLLAIDLLDVADEGVKLSQFYRPAIGDHDQNQFRDDWTELIDWVRDSYFALAKLKDGQAPLLLQHWLCLTHDLFKRLALHVLPEDDRADIELVRGILLSGEPLGLWNEELHHELMVFLRKAGHRLPKKLLGDLVAAVKLGPPRELKPHKNLDEFEQYRKWMIGLRLRKLADSGVELDGETRTMVEASRAYADLNPEREEFRVWVGVAQISAADYLPLVWEKPGLDALVMVLRKEELSEDQFTNIATKYPCRAYLALQKLGNGQDWPPRYWQDLMWEAARRIRENKFRPHRQRNLAQHLVKAPQSLFSGIGVAVADFIERFAKSCATDDEALFNELWIQAWTAISDVSNAIDADEVLTEALNSAPGRLGQAALHRLWKYSPQASAGLPEAVTSYFSKITSAPAGRLGRAMLVTELPSLFEIDPSWTRENLLPRMHWASSDEARDLWSAYAWSARAGPNLLDAFKADFLNALKHYEKIGEQRANLVRLFTAICLLEPSRFTESEVRGAIRALPEPGLIEIASFMKDQFDGSSEERAEIWRQRVSPWLRKYWPSADHRNTKGTSLALVECIINAGEAFPEAVDWASDFLRPGADHVLWSVRESGVHASFPEAALNLLLKIVPLGQVPPMEAPSMRELLDEMKEQNVELEKDPRFVNLRQRL